MLYLKFGYLEIRYLRPPREDRESTGAMAITCSEKSLRIDFRHHEGRAPFTHGIPCNRGEGLAANDCSRKGGKHAPIDSDEKRQ